MNLIDKLKALREGYKSFGHNLGIEVHNKAINKAIEIVEAHNPWISVEDDSPDTDRNVFVMDTDPSQVAVGHYHKAFGWVVHDDAIGDVTHFMEIPQRKPKTTKP